MPHVLKRESLEEPVARYVSGDVTTLRMTQTVGDALAALRKQAVGDRIIYLYVVDDGGRLTGVVPVRRLLAADLDTSIGAVTQEGAISAPLTSTVLHACETMLKHRLLALPIVDEEKRLIGVVDISLFTDEVSALLQQRQQDDLFQIIGAHVALGKRVAPWRSFKDRFPWLLCNVASGIGCAFIASLHASLISQFTVLALFVAAILALSESVSMQSMTAALQAAHGPVGVLRVAAANLRREITVAALLGLAGGLCLGLTALAFGGNGTAAAIIGGTICLSMLTACLLGVVVPTVVRALRVDPKVASGPVVLACADLVTVLFYFSMAAWLLKT